MSIKSNYESQIEQLTKEAALAKKAADSMSSIRLIFFLAALIAVIFVFTLNVIGSIILAVVAIAIFIVLVSKHDQRIKHHEHLLRLIHVNDHELKLINRDHAEEIDKK